MTTETTSIVNNMVIRDSENTWRWYDAFGPDVRKWSFDASNVVSTTTAAGQTVTQTNGTLVDAASTLGGAVVLTLGGADNDVVEVQGQSEPFYFANKWKAYFGCKFQAVDADKQGIFAGFTITDVDHEGGISDGLYFHSDPAAAAINLVFEKDAAASTTAVGTLADATDVQLEMYYDGDYVYAYVNSVLAASVAVTDANFPDDEHLSTVIANQAGEGTANNLTLYWARAIQVQAS